MKALMKFDILDIENAEDIHTWTSVNATNEMKLSRVRITVIIPVYK